jgi:hypothetical protein
MSFTLYSMGAAVTDRDPIFLYESDSELRSVSAHPTNPNRFVLCTESALILLDSNVNPPTVGIDVGSNLVSCGWLSDGVRIVCISGNGDFCLVNLEGDKIYRSLGFEPNEPAHLVMHPTLDCAMIHQSRHLVFLDFREEPAVRQDIIIDTKMRCAAFLPEGLFGAAVGNIDGSIDLVSFDGTKAPVHQEFSELEIAAMAFCPQKLGVMAFAAGTELSFATLPQWGFGHFKVTRSYAGHVEKILAVNWSAGDEPNLVLTVDGQNVIHVLEVPAEFIPLFQPDPK